jgi:N6-adenosine-specific RNA methylase IME4
MVEEVSPGPYLEMFARDKREGWHAWGNEIESDVEIAE